MLIPIWLTKPFFRKLFCFGFLLSLVSCDYLSNRLLTKPVVQVENIKLSAEGLSKSLAIKLKNLDALSAKDPKILSILKEQLVNEFIVNALIDLWLKEKNISLPKSDLDAEVLSYTSSYPNDAAFRESLAETGVSYADWVSRVEANLKKKLLAKNLAKEAAPISEEELISYYENHKTQFEQKDSVLLSHIAVDDQNQMDIVKKLLKREDFDAVAKKYSSEYTAESKAVYGWVEKEFANGLEKAFKARVGEVFGPIAVGDKLHMFKLIEKRPFKQKTFTDSRAAVLSEVVALRETARFSSWLDVQFKRYKIKKNLSMLDSIRVETQ